MKNIYQLSAFMENKKGQLAAILSVLSEHGIDLRALNVAEVSEYGVLRLIPDDPEKAQKALTEAGFVIAVNPVFAVAVPDRPGGLNDLLQLLAGDGVDIEYMYSVFGHKDGLAYMIIAAKNMQTMQESLDRHNITAADSLALGL
ncbi:MAG: ACT domain-containing protein [Eubacterium sp.]|nr:ACT domain-containing protein [Eubacterium sp.]